MPDHFSISFFSLQRNRHVVVCLCELKQSTKKIRSALNLTNWLTKKRENVRRKWKNHHGKPDMDFVDWTGAKGEGNGSWVHKTGSGWI
jgi:hypothetical protein